MRHTYTLTADGLRALDAWTCHIRAASARLAAFLERRESLRAATLAANPAVVEGGQASHEDL